MALNKDPPARSEQPAAFCRRIRAPATRAWFLRPLTVLRIIGWVYSAMFRPLMPTTAWVYAVLWVILGPLSILNAVTTFDLIEVTAALVQFAVGYYLLRYLWRSSWPSHQENARLGESDGQQ